MHSKIPMTNIKLKDILGWSYSRLIPCSVGLLFSLISAGVWGGRLGRLAGLSTTILLQSLLSQEPDPWKRYNRREGSEEPDHRYKVGPASQQTHHLALALEGRCDSGVINIIPSLVCVWFIFSKMASPFPTIWTVKWQRVVSVPWLSSRWTWLGGPQGWSKMIGLWIS